MRRIIFRLYHIITTFPQRSFFSKANTLAVALDDKSVVVAGECCFGGFIQFVSLLKKEKFTIGAKKFIKPIQKIALDKEASLMVTFSSYNTLFLWDLDNFTNKSPKYLSLEKEKEPIELQTISFYDEYILVSTSRKSSYLYHKQDATLLEEFTFFKGWNIASAFLDKDHLIFGDDFGIVSIWDQKQKELLLQYKEFQRIQKVVGFDVLSTSELLIIYANFIIKYSFNKNTLQREKTLYTTSYDGYKIFSFAVDKKQNYIALGLKDDKDNGKFLLVSYKTGVVLEEKEFFAKELAFSSDGKKMFFIAEDKAYMFNIYAKYYKQLEV